MAVTLATTTLAAPMGPGDSSALLTSLTGVIPGMRLYIDRELMAVDRYGVGNTVVVRRGISGTASTAHSSSATVTMGTADQFYEQNPQGPPPPQVLVTPWINVVNGTAWTPQGDEDGANLQARWWAQTTITHDTGALGVRTATAAPSTTTAY